MLELGTCSFAIVNVARWLDIDAEIALRDSNQRFITRFHTVERLAADHGLVLTQLGIEKLEALWQKPNRLRIV